MKCLRFSASLFASVVAISCGAENNPAKNPTRANYEPVRLAEDFFAAPFPDDTRLNAQGLVDLSRLPGRNENLLLRLFLPQVETRFRAFGTSGAVYFYFNAPLDETTLPQTPLDTLLPGSSALLVNVDPTSPYLGERVPLLIKFLKESTKFSPANTLVLLPFPGFPMRPASRYAAVLTRTVEDADGLSLGSMETFLQAEQGHLATDLKFVRSRVLAKGDDIAAAAVFTTQDVLGPLLKGAEYLRQLPSPTATSIQTKKLKKASECFDLYEGKFQEPNFLSGPAPYADPGTGIFVLAPDGTPQPQTQETLSFGLSLPKSAPPSTGFPVVIYMHGTGGDRFSFVNEDLPCLFAQIDTAVIAIDQPLHGARNPSDVPAIMLTVNLTNVNSSLDLLRQAAFDTLETSLLVRKLVVPAEITTQKLPITFDANKILFMGHSQGTTTGVPYLMIDPDVKAAMLSGSGGNMIYFVKDRLFKGDDEIADLLGVTPEQAGETLKSWFGVAGEPVDEFYFLLTLFQSVTEPVDPVNYAPYVMINTDAPKHVFMTEGFKDVYLPPSTNEALAVALGVDMLTPLMKDVPFLQVLGREPLTPPVSLNVSVPTGVKLTGGDQQYEQGRHWVVFEDDRASRQVQEFFRTYVETGSPVIIPRGEK
ncbi:MAG: hypothetical protein HYT87_03890 [Nitrospirae bacterium]|nr:hypothetical protein [Nitrospirota bacterium]